MQKISPASPADVPYLRSLAHDSEAHWGYSPEFMDKFDQDFNITASFLEENPVFAAYFGQTLAAFWGMRQSGQGWRRLRLTAERFRIFTMRFLLTGGMHARGQTTLRIFLRRFLRQFLRQFSPACA